MKGEEIYQQVSRSFWREEIINIILFESPAFPWLSGQWRCFKLGASGRIADHLLASSSDLKEWCSEGDYIKPQIWRQRKESKHLRFRRLWFHQKVRNGAAVPSRNSLKAHEVSKLRDAAGRKDLLTGWAGNLEYLWCSPWLHYYSLNLRSSPTVFLIHQRAV